MTWQKLVSLALKILSRLNPRPYVSEEQLDLKVKSMIPRAVPKELQRWSVLRSRFQSKRKSTLRTSPTWRRMINKLRSSGENLNTEFLDPNTEQSVNKGRFVPKLQQEEEVERTRIQEELDRPDEVKPEDLESSVMENSGTTTKDPAVCGELLSDNSRNSVLDPSGPEKLPKVPTVQVTEKDSSQLSHSCSEDIHMRHDVKNCAGPLAELSVGSKSLRNSLEAPKELKVEPPGFLSGKELVGEDGSFCNPEASVISDLNPDHAEFDPGGETDSPPVLKPSVKWETHQSTDFTTSTLSTAAVDPRVGQNETEASAGNSDLDFTLGPKMTEHANKNNNNNNRLGPWTYKESGDSNPLEMDTSCGSSTKVSLDPLPTEEVKTSPPNVPSDLPLMFDPGGWELDEDVPDCLQSSGATRTSLCGSPEIQVDGSTMLTDFKTPVILDMGSGLMKAGFSDQDGPTAVLPMMIGIPKYEELMNGDLEKDAYVGHEAQHMRGVLVLKHPIKNGIIQNWDDMEKIWHHTFQQLRVNPEDHPVLLTEAAMNPVAKRERLVEMMFECFNVPFTYVAMQAVLALYSAGRSTGLVFDSGDGVSHSVPVFDGYTLPHAIQRVPLAGADVTMQLKKLLQEGGVSLSTSAELEIVREMKERCCFVAVDYEAELADGEASCREADYAMPDGQVVTLHSERFRAPEVLFKPELIGREHPGVHESIFKSVISSDLDLRRHFLGNVVLSGGNTLLPGFSERLQAEIRGLLPGNMRGCVRITSPKDREFSVWRGGAVLAALPTFSVAWISRDEYEEYGPQIVGRKCF
ncbi:uncharacterized protein LOC117502613 isoform X3 [Thalassophryne amazonica]|uniref:uncharacterized protein LOC117502613 isoform X3 n=1 Tax=Thalassophryne amazonica TaxID=390379 RepID=UPI001472625D|nr:uncharacterized protein LOC117502613 isoform X3 [Thalassophryne amazonica]